MSLGKCDGQHGAPRCADTQCWQGEWRTKGGKVLRLKAMHDMSLRDEFAKAALALSGDYFDTVARGDPKNIAQIAYEIADAMLAERERKA